MYYFSDKEQGLRKMDGSKIFHIYLLIFSFLLILIYLINI